MELHRVLEGVSILDSTCPRDVAVTGLSFDSRTCRPGHLFFALPGRKVHGYHYAGEAVRNGAVAVVLPSGCPKNAPYIEVADVAEALANAAANFHHHPGDALRLVGVTGTNGKTTTTHMIRAILMEAGVACGLIGSVYVFAGQRKFVSSYTTPPAPELHAILRKMADSREHCAIMEVSSHGLALKRVHGLRYEVGVFTNLTHEHLDFHGTMDEYLAAKGLLFRRSATSILNADDPAYHQLTQWAGGNVISYGIREPADLRGSYLGGDGRGIRFSMEFGSRREVVSLPLPGRYNLGNALAAAAAAMALGASPDAAIAGLEHVEPIPGRMERIDLGQPFQAVIDYAHTPDGLKQALLAARETTTGRLISIFGGRGERDARKRPVMGAIAGELADLVIITTDSPYSEKPEAIAAEVAEGVEKANGDYLLIPGRPDAIRHACRLAESGDTILLTGRGHELWQHWAGCDQLLDDREIMKQAIMELWLSPDSFRPGSKVDQGMGMSRVGSGSIEKGPPVKETPASAGGPTDTQPFQ